MSFPSAIQQLFEPLGFTGVPLCFVVVVTWGPVSYFLFATVDIQPAFSCGIMIKSRQHSLIAELYYFYGPIFFGIINVIWSICWCVCLAWWDFMFRAGMEGTKKLKGSDKYTVPPCAQRRNCRHSLHPCMGESLFLTGPYREFCAFPHDRRRNMKCCRQNMLMKSPPSTP